MTSIQDGVGQRWIADNLVPAVDWYLAGDNQRSGVVAVLDDLQQIALLFGQQGFRPPVIKDQQIDPGKLAQQLGVTAVAAGQRQRGEQPWHDLPTPAGPVRRQ
jgi:hypothetical protein